MKETQKVKEEETTNNDCKKSSQSLLKIQQICSLLNIQESHLRSLIFRSEIPFIKIGRLIRFDPDKIKKWLEEKNFQ
ncbi:MAG: helix-turn-helix domain-containing protein [Bacteriovoracaceae bacterium]|jgi:excisionase family DNA binding protein|nr:helix-turn-helix domain-containing protein [Bacteriovoracaceae bacterium]